MSDSSEMYAFLFNTGIHHFPCENGILEDKEKFQPALWNTAEYRSNHFWKCLTTAHCICGLTWALLTVCNYVLNQTTATHEAFFFSDPQLNMLNHVPQDWHIPSVTGRKSWWKVLLLTVNCCHPWYTLRPHCILAVVSLAENCLSLHYSLLCLYLAGQLKIILSAWRAVEAMFYSSWELLK